MIRVVSNAPQFLDCDFNVSNQSIMKSPLRVRADTFAILCPMVLVIRPPQNEYSNLLDCEMPLCQSSLFAEQTRVV